MEEFMKIVTKSYFSSLDGGTTQEQIGDFLPEDLDKNGKLIFDTEFLTKSDCINDNAFDKIKDLVREIEFPNGIHKGVRICDFKNLTTLSIPRTIHDLDISNCPALESVHLSEGVKSLGHNAGFNGCKSLRFLVLPESFDMLYADSFIGCDSLEKIVIKGDKFSVYDPSKLNNEVFCNCKNLKEVEFLKTEFGKKYWINSVDKNADAFLLIQSEFMNDEKFVKNCLVKIASKFGLDKAESILKQKKEIEKKKFTVGKNNKENIKKSNKGNSKNKGIERNK